MPRSYPKFHEDYLGEYYYDAGCNEVVMDLVADYRLEATVMVDLLLDLVKAILEVQRLSEKQ